MKIGIDISQLAYEKTGVANYLGNLVQSLVAIDKSNEYILFYSSFRKRIQNSEFNPSADGQNYNSKVKIKTFRIPPTLLEFLWNRLHIAPIEWFIGDVDLYITSDWAEPPSLKAKKMTILYDLIVYKYPEETHNKTKFSWKKFLISSNIVASQKRRLKWVKKESDVVFCISESTKRDAMEILGIKEKRLKVIYPGI